MVTLEDIETELDPSKQTSIRARFESRAKKNIMDGLIKKLKIQEGLTSPETVKTLLLGKRKLTAVEFEAAAKKFGVAGINGIQAMESLSKVQKQYIFKRMGYDIAEVE